MNYKHTLLKLSGATFIAQVLSILLIPAISRLYSTSSFAEFAYWVSIGGLIGGVITLKQEQFFLSRPKKEWDEILARIFLLHVIFFSLTTIAATYLLLVNDIQKATIIILIFMYGASTSLIISFSNIANIEGSFSALAKARVYMSLALGAGQVGLGILSSSFHSLFIGAIIGQIVFLIFIYIDIRSKIPNIKFSNISLPSYDDSKRCAFSIFSTITLSIATSFPPVLLFSLGFQHEAGIVALLQRFLLFPATLMAMPLSQAFVFFLGQRKNNPLDKKFLALSVIFTLSVYFVFYVASIFSEKISLFNFVLGSNWAEADLLVTSIATIYASLLLRNISNQYFLVREKQSVLYRLDAIYLISLAVWYFNSLGSGITYQTSMTQLNFVYIIYSALPIAYIVLKNLSINSKEYRDNGKT